MNLPARLALLASVLVPLSVAAQSVPAPTVTVPIADAGRPLPGPLYEAADFTRAVERGTRTRNGTPGPNYWVQHARYTIHAALDPKRNRLTGTESVIYINHSPDTLARIAVHLRQNVFAPDAPRLDQVPITGGVTLTRVAVGNQALPSLEEMRARSPATTPRRRGQLTGTYDIRGTVMWIALPVPLLPGDSTTLDFAWSYVLAPTPSDGREGRDGHVYYMGYWYPQVAVYDDVDGWVADPYLLGAEFYMDPADYDVHVTVPRNWVVGATGTLQNPGEVLSVATRDSLAAARASGRVIRILTPGKAVASVFAKGKSHVTWHYTATSVRDFAWGTSDQYAWDATGALVHREGSAAPDTVAINSYFRLTDAAAAWATGGARYTRDAIEQMSAYLWPYPWPAMSSMEGVLTSGGMEYPMLTLMQPWADTLSLAGDLMHETGHMWFPMQVGSNETRFPWMDEGLTQYDEAQGLRVLYGEPRSGGRPADTEQGQRRLYLRAAREGREPSLMLPGDAYPGDLYNVMYYDKTAQVLAALRGMAGKDRFQQALRQYGRQWAGRHPQPYDFFNAMSGALGQDLDWFWNTWFVNGWPLDQAIESVTTTGDSTTVTIADRGLAPMPVPLAITRSDGTVERKEIPVSAWLSGARRATLTVRATPRVTRVTIDPDGFFPDINPDNQAWSMAP